MNKEKIKEIFSDEQFVRDLLEMDTVQEVQGALSKKGLDLSEEQLNDIRESLIKMSEKGEGELSETELDDVAGGFVEYIVVGIGLAIIGAGVFASAGDKISKWKW